MKKQMQVSTLVIILLIVTACSDKSITTSSPAPFFPQQSDPKPDFMDALLVGELVLVDSCLRIMDTDDNNYLPIWPQGFSLRMEKNIIQIVDDMGQIVAQVGDKLEVSGGEMPAEHITEYSAQPIPSDCPGPYWIVGNQINR